MLHYANGMVKAIVLSALLLPGVAAAVICKTVEPDGTVSYADVPAAECNSPVKLPPYSRYAPRQPAAPREQTSSATGTQVSDFAGYQSARIVQPESNGTVRNNEGMVPVVMVTEPALQPGHKVEYRLDGKKIEGSFTGTSVVLNNVDRGTHTVTARIVDPTGVSLIEAPGVRFTLRRTGLNDRPAEPSLPVEPAPDSSPGNGSAFTPPAAPGYRPPAGPAPATPGATNPAFAPRYGG